jgi:hypothetical protein
VSGTVGTDVSLLVGDPVGEAGAKEEHYHSNR